MKRLLKIARTATPGSGIQFRKDKYGSSGIRSFLRDVLAMANAPVDGPRYIIIGVDFDSRGRKTVHAVDVEDFSGKPSYQSLANEFIEPPLRIRYKPVTIDGHRVGVFEIAAYPSVSLKDDSVQVTSKIGDIPVGEPVDVFISPLRLCVGKDLSGKRFGVRYALHGRNLRSPAKGNLRLLFR